MKIGDIFEYNFKGEKEINTFHRLLHQIEAEPPFFSIAKTVIMELCQGHLSAKSQKILDLFETGP